ARSGEGDSRREVRRDSFHPRPPGGNEHRRSRRGFSQPDDPAIPRGVSMKRFLRFSMASLACALAMGAFAQGYPERPITLVVPFAAGGATDTLARQFAERMARGARQPIVVENVSGAGGTVGATKVAKAKPDGYTFLVGHVGYMAAAPGLYKQLGY